MGGIGGHEEDRVEQEPAWPHEEGIVACMATQRGNEGLSGHTAEKGGGCE